MYGFLQLIRRWACTLSPAAAKRWGERLGRFFWWIVPKRRKRLAIDNILFAGLTSDPQEAARIAKASALRFGPMALDVMRFPIWRDGKITERVTLEQTDFLDELYAQGKGCILATSHCGNWEIFGGAVGTRYPGRVVAVGFQQADAAFDRFIRESRSMLGQTVIYPQNMRQIMRLLDEGKFIALLYDQDTQHGGILAPLFDTYAVTVTGPAVLSYSRNVPIVQAHIRQDGERYIGAFEAPLYTRKDVPKKQAIAEMTAILNESLAERVRRQPEEWFWMHNRWKWTRRHYGDPKQITADTPPLAKQRE